MNKDSQNAGSASGAESLNINISKGASNSRPAAAADQAAPKKATTGPTAATRPQTVLQRPQRISYAKPQADIAKKPEPSLRQPAGAVNSRPHAPKPQPAKPQLTKPQPAKPQASATQTTSKRAAGKKKSNNQTTIMFACAAIAICLTALITWGVISMLNRGKISEDATFATNDSQTTITIEPTESDSSSVSHTRTVYEYDGDNVVGMKTYFEYADNEAAKAAYEAVKNQPEFKGAEVIDKYIVVTADPNQFKGLTADDIRQQAEAIEQFQNSRKKSTPQPDQTEQPEEHPEERPEEHTDSEASEDGSSSPDEG